MKPYYRKVGWVLLAIPVSLLLSSSRYFDTLQILGKQSDAIDRVAGAIAEDFYKSCLRRSRYLFAPTTTPEQRSQLTAECEEIQRRNVESFQQANAIVTDYMRALSALASGETIAYGKQPSAIEQSLTALQVPVANPSPAPTVVALGTNSVANGTQVARYLALELSQPQRDRQTQAKRAVLCTNQEFETYLRGTDADDGLVALVENGYLNGLLASEKAEIESYQSGYLELYDTLSNTEVDRARLKSEVNRRAARAQLLVEAREEAARKYVKALQATATLHEKLAGALVSPLGLSLDAELVDLYCSGETDTDLLQPGGAFARRGGSQTQANDDVMGEVAREYQLIVEPLTSGMDGDLTRAEELEAELLEAEF